MLNYPTAAAVGYWEGGDAPYTSLQPIVWPGGVVPGSYVADPIQILLVAAGEYDNGKVLFSRLQLQTDTKWQHMVAAIQAAKDFVTDNTTILHGYSMMLTIIDSKCDSQQ